MKLQFLPSIPKLLEKLTIKRAEYEAAIEAGESPIEKLFTVVAYDILGKYSSYEPQYNIGPYRVDVALPAVKIVIELDGHEYHNSKEQRTADNKRQRELIRRGWLVIRFTGSEVYNSPLRCVNEVVRIIKARQL